MEEYKNYKYNKEILSETKVQKFSLSKVLDKWENKIDTKLKQSMLKHYNQHFNENIVYWFNLFSKKYMKKDCKLFNYIIKSMYIKLELIRLNGISYVKKI